MRFEITHRSGDGKSILFEDRASDFSAEVDTDDVDTAAVESTLDDILEVLNENAGRISA
jgi:hypothetical protein